MAKKRLKPKSPFLGRWHIISMSAWDEDYFNDEVQAHIEFGPDQGGEFDCQPVPGQVARRLPRGEPWLGLVVSVPGRLHLANVLLEVPPPTVNDLDRLLAHAMNRPLVDRAHRPARILLRDNPA